MKEANFSEQQKKQKALIEEQRASGLSQVEFCKRRGIAVGTFYGWVASLKKKEKRPKLENHFIRIADNSVKEPVRVEFQSGVSLHFAQAPDPEWFHLLMKLVS